MVKRTLAWSERWGFDPYYRHFWYWDWPKAIEGMVVWSLAGLLELLHKIQCTNDTLTSQILSYGRHIWQQSQGFANSINRYPISTCALSPGPLRRMQLSKAYTLRRVYSACQILKMVVACVPGRTEMRMIKEIVVHPPPPHTTGSCRGEGGWGRFRLFHGNNIKF